MKTSSLFTAVAALILSLPVYGSSLTLGAPGNGNNIAPFGGDVNATFGPGTRYQQAYASGDFAGLGPIWITSIDFLGGYTGGNIAANTYTFSFSTITAGIDSLSDSNFDSNLGSNNAVFVTVNLSGAAPATLTITGSSPFLYDPSQGNLLLDIVISPGGQIPPGPTPTGYEELAGTSLFSRYYNSGAGTTGYGLVTEFDYTSTPEPTTFALVATGIVLLWRRRFRLRTATASSTGNPQHPAS